MYDDVEETAARWSADDFVYKMECENSYERCKKLEDGSYATLLKLMYTTAICLDVTDSGYDARFCFEDRSKALEEFDKLKSCDDVPEGWIARR
jgi:hypothetical protein